MDEEIHGASNNQLILAACRNDQDEWLNDLLAQGDFDISFTDDNGNTSLHYATKYGALACLELLVRVAGIHMNSKNAIGDTPLHNAVQYKDDPEIALEMVNILLDAGANPRIENKNKDSPLSLVKDINNEDMNDLLTSVLVEGDEEEEQEDDDDDEDDMIDDQI
ncbi:ankyrin repeat-containing domain protein [Halteromyces radiatus]|uniref:ankyrin repeat-containing domain protein n=1 Tax=Halteromyces radiatus TaxID=101107 RepID=UPI00221E5312|nr:ankyrin repeat-containing domain protein [Halteromyces radiatus]KAI8083094.1 ankyrin repeat-containing domain protein [Halteromyces radiatus]